MKIAIVGSRGIPARYSGFETFAEELCVRLVQRGYDVTVYCRRGNYDDSLKEYKGVKLIHLPRLNTKITDTVSSTLFQMFHSIWKQYDIVFVMNTANSPFCIIPKLMGRTVMIDVDGLDWKRAKWGTMGKLYYQLCEWVATKVTDLIISDSLGMVDYYRRRYRKDTRYVAYGAQLESSKDPSLLKKYGLEKDGYFLSVARLEPENNQHISIKAFEKVDTDKKLFLVGGANYRSWHVAKLRSTKDSRVIFPGGIFDRDMIRELWCNCYAYIHGNEVGGTSLALLQALGHGCAVLALDVSFNRYTIGEAGMTYKKSPEDLAEKIRYALDNPEQIRKFRVMAKERVSRVFVWEQVVDEYEKIFHDLTGRR
jgi:glycosyltransferase involved in cell wall biosynthesis